MRVLCIARHAFLSGHIARLCAETGAECRTAVGSDAGLRAARLEPPDVVLWEVDLLLPEAVTEYERDPKLARVPMLAVSLTRRQNESPVLPGPLIAGYLYLPSLSREALGRALCAATGRPVVAPDGAYRWQAVPEPAPASAP